jgi:hypothetical protein
MRTTMPSMDAFGVCCGVPGTCADCNSRKRKDASACDLIPELLEDNAVGKSK